MASGVHLEVGEPDALDRVQLVVVLGDHGRRPAAAGRWRPRGSTGAGAAARGSPWRRPPAAARQPPGTSSGRPSRRARRRASRRGAPPSGHVGVQRHRPDAEPVGDLGAWTALSPRRPQLGRRRMIRRPRPTGSPRARRPPQQDEAGGRVAGAECSRSSGHLTSPSDPRVTPETRSSRTALLLIGAGAGSSAGGGVGAAPRPARRRTRRPRDGACGVDPAPAEQRCRGPGRRGRPRRRRSWRAGLAAFCDGLTVEDERGEARDVRRGHRRAREERVARVARVVGADDVDARRRDLDVGVARWRTTGARRGCPSPRRRRLGVGGRVVQRSSCRRCPRPRRRARRCRPRRRTATALCSVSDAVRRGSWR